MPEPPFRLLALARGALGLVLALAMMTAVSALAHLPVGEAPAGAALRLALRTREARLEICHDRSDAELAALPAHLRQRRICDEVAIDYRLAVAVDGEPRLERRLRHRGLRRTRPLVVDELVEVPAGAHRVVVELSPLRPETGLVGSEARAVSLRAAFERLAAPRLESDLDFERGRIVLVVLDGDGALRTAG